MELVNLTPHDITARVGNPLYGQLNEPEMIDWTIKASGQVARLETSALQIPWPGECPLVSTSVGRIVGLPEPALDTWYIVSMPVAQACPNRLDVIAPDTGDTCIRENGKIVAVTRFTRYYTPAPQMYTRRQIAEAWAEGYENWLQHNFALSHDELVAKVEREYDSSATDKL